MGAEKSRSERRLRSMLDEHFDFVWRTVRRMGVREADADDAAQEVFVVAARRISSIEPSRERAFLFGTALRVASTSRRAARRRPEDPSFELEETAESGPSPEELADLGRARVILEEILDGMSEEQRAVFILCELEELEAPKVAELLTIPLGTVHSRLRGAREVFSAAVKRLVSKRSFGESKA